MTTKVFANSRTITHQGDGLTQVAAPPDVCNTPSPGGPPVPVPYVNSAQDAQLVNGSKRTTIGGHPIALESSSIAISAGDEPGTAGGIISAKFKGKLTWATCSPNVRIEGKGVVRFMDVTQHNGNSFNTTFIQSGGTGFAYADDFTGLCPICNKGPDSHAVPEMVEGSAAIAAAIRKDLNALEAKAKAAKRAGASKAERHVLESHRAPKKRGYMVGVMTCKCSKKFAAISGKDAPPAGFTQVAKVHGCQLVSEPAHEQDFLKANPLPKSVGTMMRAWSSARTKGEDGNKGYSPPGLCAAAKLTMKSGHIPVSMTEFYFVWTDEKKAPWQSYKMSFRGPASIAPASSDGPWKPPAHIPKDDEFADTEVEDVKRAFGDTVTSCNTCREILRFTMCDRDERTCASSQEPAAESAAPLWCEDPSKPGSVSAPSAQPTSQPAEQPFSMQSSDAGSNAQPNPATPAGPTATPQPPMEPSEAPSWGGGGGRFGGGGASGSWEPEEPEKPKGPLVS